MTKCKDCGFDHQNPEGMEAAVRILACVLRDVDFYTRKGKVPKTKEEELKERSQAI